MRTLLAGMISLSMVLGCTPVQEPRMGPADVTVELDAFSGLPNPSWTLSPAEAGELAARLRDLPRAGASQLPEPVLVYRGFWIRNPDGEGGVPATAYVSHGGLIRVATAGVTGPIFRDERDAEAWLIEVAKRRGHADVFRR